MAGIPLGVDGVVLVVQALVGGLAGVDRAAQAALHSLAPRRPPFLGLAAALSPKKSGPDQRMPVISRETRLAEVLPILKRLDIPRAAFTDPQVQLSRLDADADTGETLWALFGPAAAVEASVSAPPNAAMLRAVTIAVVAL
jgi:hypothetical protein